MSADPAPAALVRRKQGRLPSGAAWLKPLAPWAVPALLLGAWQAASRLIPSAPLELIDALGWVRPSRQRGRPVESPSG